MGVLVGLHSEMLNFTTFSRIYRAWDTRIHPPKFLSSCMSRRWWIYSKSTVSNSAPNFSLGVAKNPLSKYSCPRQVLSTQKYHPQCRYTRHSEYFLRSNLQKIKSVFFDINHCRDECFNPEIGLFNLHTRLFTGRDVERFRKCQDIVHFRVKIPI